MEDKNTFLIQALETEFPDSILSCEEPYGFLTLEVKKEDVKRIIHHLKDSSLRYIFLTDICGIHIPDRKDKELGVIYHLHALERNHRVRIKCFMPETDAVVDSVTDLFAGANWMERETYDFYGIKFRNHPDMRIILNDTALGYHPMRKEFPLEDATRADKNDAMFGR